MNNNWIYQLMQQKICRLENLISTTLSIKMEMPK